MVDTHTVSIQKIWQDVFQVIGVLLVANIIFLVFKADPQIIIAAERFFLQTSGVITYAIYLTYSLNRLKE